MGNIVLLDDLTINKIAAGEVIERPASVVKELVENSIDAGATNICVEIRNGGISYIRVTDNGKGIMPDDMEIAFERHATSKIRTATDLETVKSMGFRGEALASIAAIAKVTMRSKTKDQEMGHEVVAEGGNILKNEETGCPNGTSITVENLFFNTPVRYKFLKKDFTESGYIEDAMTRIALIHPEIAIKLINTGKTIIQTSGSGDLKSVVYGIYGKEIAENLLNVNYEYEDIKVTGVIGKPIIARSNRSNQLFFVNKRYVKDKSLTSSAEQAYKGMITIGKFGFLILNIEVDPHKVDVNVHPAKLEVRFSEEQKVFKAVYHAIKDTLLQGEFIGRSEERATLDIAEPKIEPRMYPKAETKIAPRMEDFKRVEEEPKSVGLFAKLMAKREERKDEVESFENKNEEIDDKPNIMREIFEKRARQEEQYQANRFKQPETITIGSNIEESKNAQTLEMPKIEDTKTVEIPKETLNIENTQKVEIPREMPNIENVQKAENETNQSIISERQEEQNVSNYNEKVLETNQEENPHQQQNEDKSFENMYVSIFGKSAEKNLKINEEPTTYKIDTKLVTGENISMFKKEMQTTPAYKFIGIAFSTYIIIELENDLYLIDQHAAHERIMYEKVKQNYYSQGPKDSQMMLLPDIITLTNKEMDIAKENIGMFEKAGCVLEEFGENTIKLTGVPNICIDLDTKELFLETLDEINTVARTAKQEKEEKFIATVACKAAVKAHMALSREEVDSLMVTLLQLPNPFTCPHGRPTAIKMTKNDIERKFSRR